MSKDTGGPAFPCVHSIVPSPQGDTDYEDREDGMTLLDWFAGQALSGLAHRVISEPEKEVAAWSYALAEAMLAEKRRREAGA